MGRWIGAMVGIACLLLGLALGVAALPPVSAGQEYRQTIGWLDLSFDGLGLYFALLGLLILGLGLLAGRWFALWQGLPLLATYFTARSYTLGEWPLWMRLTAEVGAALLIMLGLAGVTQWRTLSPRQPQWGRRYPGVGLVAWGMVALAICSAEPTAVAGGLILAANAALLGVAISGGAIGIDSSRLYTQDGEGDESRPYRAQLSTFNFLQIFGLWLYLHAALGRGELFYAALMLAGAIGMAVGLLRLGLQPGGLGGIVATLSLAGFAAGGMIVDLLLRPALAGLAGLPAWSSLKLARLDLPVPQPDAAVGIGLQAGSNASLLPLLALALAFGFALALGWLLYRLLGAIRHEG
jgi:hypothetical protein